MESLYKQEFYQGQQNPSLESARQIVPYLVNAFHPKSVVDVGCGTGPWLKAFLELDIQDCLGIDGEWVRPDMLLIPPGKFITAQLTAPPRLGRRFDLVVSVEVAEHLPVNAAETFVEYLTGLAPVVAFSAAIPGQGGTSHLNEQWQSYWCNLFRKYDYIPHDTIRKQVWKNPKVCYWYAQNLIVYIEQKYAHQHGLLLPSNDNSAILDVVHPTLFREALQPENLSTTTVLRSLPKVLKRALKFSARKVLRGSSMV